MPTLGEYPRRRNIAAECISDPEGVDEAFATADRIIEDEYRVQRQYQAYIEPKGAVAIYQGGRTRSTRRTSFRSMCATA